MPRSRWLASIVVVAAVASVASGCSSTRTDGDEESLGVVDQALNSGFRLPFKCGVSMTVTQGNNSALSHNGVSAYGFDFGAALNTPLVAAKAGRVSFARNDIKPGNPCYAGGGPGCASTLNYVTVDHGDGTSTVYAHLNAVNVTVGQLVKQGQQLGLSGGTGYSTGPHTHLQRQTNCGAFYCQSIPMSFDDVTGAGVPVAGQAVKSQNSCAGADCALGDGRYCGGNGVKGDKSTLFFCTNGTPKVEQKCQYGCKPMAPGIDDRCATASEAPAPDAGADGAADAAATAAGGEAGAPAQPAASPSSPEGAGGAPEAPIDAEPEAAASGCSMARSRSVSVTPHVTRESSVTVRDLFAPLFAACAALALLARRRRTR